MPSRSVKLDEFAKLNELLEVSYGNANKDHRFVRIYQEKPLVEGFGRVYEYDPAIEKDAAISLSKKTFVAFFGLYKQYLQYGHSVILNGGGRSVASHPVARGKGYGLKIAEDAKKFMLENEVDISILFSGAQHFYEKLGWRGGMHVPNYEMDENSLQTLLHQEISGSPFDLQDMHIRGIEQADIPALSQLRDKSLSGFYFAAHRTEEFWDAHFKFRPALLWNYFVVEHENQLLAYLRLDFLHQASREVQIKVEEFHVAPSLNKIGTPVLTQILQCVVNGLSEDVLQEEDRFIGISFALSESNSLIKHLYYERVKLKNLSGISINTMIMITNPYSLFTKLEMEYQARMDAGFFPSGQFVLQFDRSGVYPGGLLIQNNAGALILTVSDQNADLLNWKQEVKNYAVFDSISELSIYFANIEPVSELEDDGDPDCGVKIEGEGKMWLLAMFSEVTNDLAGIDHY